MLEFLKFTQTYIGVITLWLFFGLLILNYIYFKLIYPSRFKLIKLYTLNNTRKKAWYLFIDILIVQIVIISINLLLIKLTTSYLDYSLPVELADKFINKPDFLDPHYTEFIFTNDMVSIWKKSFNYYQDLFNLIMVICGASIFTLITYMFLSNKYIFNKLKNRFISEYNRNNIPFLITNINNVTTQQQTRNIYTGAILYALPEKNQLKTSIVNVSGKNVKGFEIVIKKINSFNEVTNERKIVVDEFIPNNYKPIEINVTLNSNNYNTYSISRVIFSDGLTWSE